MGRHVHNAVITSYEVRSILREIELRIEFSHTAVATEHSLIVFHDVEGYHLKDDSFGSIILDIEQVTVADILRQFGGEIAESFRNSGAFGGWAADLNSAADILDARNIRGYILSGSIGHFQAGYLLQP